MDFDMKINSENILLLLIGIYVKLVFRHNFPTHCSLEFNK